MNNNTIYYFSGTVGDAYIAICKLYELSKTKKVSLQRISRIEGSDKTIKSIISFFPNIEYIEPFIFFDTIKKMKTFAFKNSNNYLNIYFDGNGRENEPDDPHDIIFSAHPIIKKRKEKLSNKLIIGIQINSGSRKENSKILSPEWVEDFCKYYLETDVEIIIFASTKFYEIKKLKLLKKMKNVSILIDYPLKEWMCRISQLDFFITPEGFPAFWALSQKVPTISFFYENSAVLRMHQKWRDIAVLIKLEKPNGIYYPINPNHIFTIITSKLNPNFL